MSNARIIRPQEVPPVDRGPGIKTHPMVGPNIGATSITNGMTHFEPGKGIPMHTHNVDESVTIMEGEGTFESEGQTQVLKPFETTFVPTGVPHRFVNNGQSGLTILWCYPSSKVSRTFIESGETVEHLSERDRVT